MTDLRCQIPDFRHQTSVIRHLSSFMIQTFKTHLTVKQRLTHDTVLFHFTLDEPKELEFIAGQYLVLFIPDGSGDYLRRLYSIASPPAMKNSFELIAKIVKNGIASEYFNRMTIGEEVLFQGPAGRFILKDHQKNKVFLATGTGIAPIFSILKTVLPVNYSPLPISDIPPHVILSDSEGSPNLFRNSHSRDLPRQDQNDTKLSANHQSLITHYTLLWGIPTYRDVYLFDELKQMAAAHPNFTFTICLSRESTLDMIPEPDRKHFMLGRITKPLDELVKTGQSSSELVEMSTNSTHSNQSQQTLTNSNQFQQIPTNTDFYLCGNRDVVESLRSYLAAQQIPKENVVFEKF